MSMAVFFNITTVFLLFVAAGLFSTAIHELQEATETYEHVVWKLNCCDPKKNLFWSIMSTIFGWRIKATVGTTVGYFVYWAVVGLAASFMLYREKRNRKNSSLENNDQSNNVEKNENERDGKDYQVNVA